MYNDILITGWVFGGLALVGVLIMIVVAIAELVRYGSCGRRYRARKFTERPSGDTQHDPPYYHGPRHHGRHHHDAAMANNVANDMAMANTTAGAPGITHHGPHGPHGIDGGDERSEHSSVTLPRPTYQRRQNALKNDMGSDESYPVDSLSLYRTSHNPRPSSMMDKFPLRVFRWGRTSNNGQTNGDNSRNSEGV